MEKLNELNGCKVDTQQNVDRELKALVYIKEYNMIDFERFKKGLMSQFGGLREVRASWIKVKDNRTKPLLLHLKGNEIPTYLEIPREQDKSKVYEYKNRPSMCQKCQEYGHRTKFCTNKMKCRKCYEATHIADKCQREDSGCFHCRGIHRTGNRICPQCRYEEEIEAIQGRERVNRTQARLILQSRTPNDKMNYASVFKEVPRTYSSRGREYTGNKGRTMRGREGRGTITSGNTNRMRKPYIGDVVHNDSGGGKYLKERCGEYAVRGSTERDA